MAAIIGLDFGNFNTVPCYISDFDIETRMGGTVRDLIPPKAETRDGIPSVYFYSKSLGVLIGENAVESRAVPLENRLRYLKRHLGEEIVINDNRISYDEAITQVIQHAVRSANKRLYERDHLSTNLIALAYPASYHFSQVIKLIELAEKATLDDGTHIKVNGTIAEPAAAALDYLAGYEKSDRDTTVLVYDLGGGTFDLGLVSAYPRGKKRPTGEIYYYDVINTRGLPKLGGAEFDDVIYEILLKKIGKSLNARQKIKLKNEAEAVKVRLTDSLSSTAALEIGDEYVEVPVTRTEFENATKKLVEMTINETRIMLDEHANHKPEKILLTGGASRMPMIKETLERAFPEYKGKIEIHNPSMAIACGAARYGTKEKNEEPSIGHNENGGKGITIIRIPRDIGIEFTDKDNRDYVVTYVKAGTELPFDGGYRLSATRYDDQRESNFLVCEANKTEPDKYSLGDWDEIMRVKIIRDYYVPKGTESETCIKIDKSARVQIDARDTDYPDKIVHNEVDRKSVV